MTIGARLKAAWAVLAGPTDLAREAKREESSDSAAELARVRLALERKDEEIAQLRKEYELREHAAKKETASAGGAALGALMKKLAPTLSQLATLRHMGGQGREIRVQDVLKLTAKLEDALRAQGLEPIGEVGAETEFDPALHQRMSGGDVRDGTPVRVRFPGYRFAGDTPLKAMVRRIGDEQEKAGEEV